MRGGVVGGTGGISVKSEGGLLAERGQDEREMMRMYWRRSKVESICCSVSCNPSGESS